MSDNLFYIYLYIYNNLLFIYIISYIYITYKVIYIWITAVCVSSSWEDKTEKAVEEHFLITSDCSAPWIGPKQKGYCDDFYKC